MASAAPAPKNNLAPNLGVVSGNKPAGKSVEARPRMTSAEVLDTVAAVMLDPKDVANRKHQQAEEKRLKDEALNQKNEDERHKLLQEAQDQGAAATSLMEQVVKGNQEIVRLQFEYKKAPPEEREKIKAKALATSVNMLENIERALSPLKASKSSLMGRLQSVWEFDAKDINAVVKERKMPKVQFELNLGDNRRRYDGMHETCEKNGAPRMKSTEKADVKAKAAHDA